MDNIMGYVYDNRFQPINEPIMDIKYGHCYYHPLTEDKGRIVAYMTVNNSVTVKHDGIKENVTIAANMVYSSGNHGFTDGNKIIINNETVAHVEGNFTKDDVIVATAALIVAYHELQKYRDEEIAKEKRMTKIIDRQIVPDEDISSAEDVAFFQTKMEKALNDNDGGAESVFYILNKDKIRGILNTDQTPESLFLNILSLSGFNTPTKNRTRDDGYILSNDGSILVDDIQINLNLMNDEYADNKNGHGGIPNYSTVKNKFKKRSFSKKSEKECAKIRGYYIKNDGKEYLDEELMKNNRSQGKFCDGIIGIYGIPFDLKTDFDYPDKYKSDRNPTKNTHFFYDGLVDEDKLAYKLGYYNDRNTPYISEQLRHYNVLIGRFVDGKSGKNGVPQRIIDYNEKLNTNKNVHVLNNKNSLTKTETNFLDKKTGWNIWITLSLLSLLIFPILYAIIYNDAITGIALWVTMQIFSWPGYIVAYLDFKNKLKRPFALILIVMGGITLGFLSYVYPIYIIPSMGLIVTFIIRMMCPDDVEMPIGQPTPYRSYPINTYEIIREVDKVVYIVLAIFLGALGVHRFYAGKNLSGVVYILLMPLGISPLLGLIDGLVAIGSQKNEYGKLPVYKNKYFV